MTQAITVQLHVEAKMDRTVPAPLQSIIPASEWMKFCDSVDAVVEPYVANARCITVMPFLAFLFGGVALMVGFIRKGNQDMNSFNCSYDYECNGNTGGTPAGLILGPMLIVGSIIFSLACIPGVERGFMSKINKICEETSKKFHNPSTTFHFKKHTSTYRDHDGDRHYNSNYFFEILTTAGTAGFVPPVVEAMAVPYDNNERVQIPKGSDENEESSPARRLAKLETLKGMITQAEFEKKRKEILDSV